MNPASPPSRDGCPPGSVLSAGWELASTAPGACADAAAARSAGLAWRPAVVPGTVAACLGADVTAEGRHDALDWWYRCTFEADPSAHALRFEGLATVAEVWLNGERVLDARNMFVPHAFDAGARLRPRNELLVCLRSLDQALAARRPRPRWKTALVPSQNLRWERTTLLGRMPGWNPPVQPVGLWKPVVLEGRGPVGELELDVQARVEGRAGVVAVRGTFDGPAPSAARVRVGDTEAALSVAAGGLSGEVTVPDVPLWWPHTHGEPATLPCVVEVRSAAGWVPVHQSRLGFRTLRVDRTNGLVRFIVNGAPVFCRGACWTTDDLVSLHADPRATLELAREAGLNMVRLGGTMTYESDAFYASCDELGILVWQDFMFANMDYPVGDEAFLAEVTREATFHLRRLQRHACVAAYCGGSEVEQQAAMLGLPASEWTHPFFSEVLPALCARLHAGVPYFRSSPSEGALPFHVATGIAHYYGVGAYRRPLADVKSAGVKFATECLGFSNVPEPETVAVMMGGTTPPAHHPLWKARQPRDVGSGWDFEDIRDHYLRELFGLDPVTLRSRDTERYLQLSRVVTGEVMRRVYAEWRAPRSVCGGGLVWLLKDVWPGAGWGLIDSLGRPKAAYWYLKRAWAPRSVGFTDEGVDGLQLHVTNDVADVLEGTVEFAMFQHGQVRVAAAEAPVRVEPRAGLTLSADAMLGRFADTAYAYRFGPPPNDVAVVRLRAADGSVIAEDFHFPQGLDLPMASPKAFEASAERLPDGRVAVTIACDTFLQSVHFDCAGFRPDDAHFHVAPGSPRRVVFHPLADRSTKFKAHVGALNLRDLHTLRTD